jgi:hypothetical protein
MHAFLVSEELPTIGTRGYTDESSSEDESERPESFYFSEEELERLSSDHADMADVIIESCVDHVWYEKAREYDLKGSIMRELEGGRRRHAIDAVLSDFLDQALAEEELSEAEEDLETAVWMLDEEKNVYEQHCHAAAQICLSKELVWGAAHAARTIASGNRFPANSAAVFKPRISSALLCRVAQKHVLLSSGLLRTLVHRLTLPDMILRHNVNCPSPSARKNRVAIVQRACSCSLVSLLSRLQISHNSSRWLARLDVGSVRFAQRSAWLLRNQSSNDDEHVDIYITDGDSQDHAEDFDEYNCNAERVQVENKIQEVEDLVTVGQTLFIVFLLELHTTNAMQCVAGSLR